MDRRLLSNVRNVYVLFIRSASSCQWSRVSSIKIDISRPVYANRPEKYLINSDLIFTRHYSADKSKELAESRYDEQTAVSTSVAERIKEGTKTAAYAGFVFMGFGVALVIFYAVFSELFSSKSPHKVYSKAVDYVISDDRVQNAIGDQIKSFGEETRRGRRQHVSHIEYEKDGRTYLRMKFHVKGNRASGTVHLEMVENDAGKFEYRYLFVIVDDVYRKTIILEDNRNKYDGSSVISPLFTDQSGEPFKELDLSLK